MVDKYINQSNGESGILRKSAHQYNTTENREDLLVFGYACKIFRDEEKARYIDQGKHLIPWMGDQSLKIDRYDVRATLPDLIQYEVPPGGYSNRLDYLTTSEQKAEQLCEEERYFSLYHNDQDEKMYQEEELKRLHQMGSSTFGQVGFNYENNQSNDNGNELTKDGNEQTSEEQEEIFVPPLNFDIPLGIEQPETMKEHAIIEKTAKFISTQGAQMEILIKTKQANNSQFDFLMQNNRLNVYYKHVLNAIKTGNYPKDEIQQLIETNHNVIDSIESNNIITENPYFSSIPTRTVPTIVYKPSADCSYTQLISKITGVPLPKEQSIIELPSQSDTSMVPTTATTQYTQLNSALNPKNFNFNSYPSAIFNTPTIIPPPPPIEIVNFPPVYKLPTENNFTQNSSGVEVKKISTGLMLAQYYNSDSESEDDDESDSTDNLNFPFPPDSLQNIIDKTAGYVIKNGKNFEDILRTKEDPRFSFLDDTNEFHQYYLYKVTGRPPNNTQTTENGMKNSGGNVSVKQKIITPVSFSIKTKDEQTIPTKAALPQEPSSDEDDNIVDLDEKNKQKMLELKPNFALDNINLEQQNQQQSTISLNIKDKEQGASEKFELANEIVYGNELPKNEHGNFQGKLYIRDTKKISEEKLRDKLATAAREKMGSISKEKQLQLERKKKAMAFLNQMKIPSLPSIPKSNESTSNDITKLNTLEGNDSDIESLPTSPTNLQRKITEKNTDHQIISQSRSRSRSKSSNSRHKKKKSKSHHSKRKTKRKSRSRSRSWSRERKFRKESSSHRSNSVRHNRYRDD